MVQAHTFALLAATALFGSAGCMFAEVREQRVEGEAAAAGDAQLANTIGELTSVGDIVTLADERFSRENAQRSLWRPLEFVVSSRPGVYFLEPYDPRKKPVLFVHGINGSPANFAYLIGQLDRARFQPWVYSYPSGARLALIVDHLTQTVMKLEAVYGVNDLVVVAHSMGGLVARGFILRHTASSSSAHVPLFVSISTPWAGHPAAEAGTRYAPVVVEVWRDMTPTSEYLADLFATPLPETTFHHLIFTFARNSASFGASDDRVVSVASQLRVEAQTEAARIHGIDATHAGVLSNARAARLLNRILETTASVSE